MLDRTMVEHAFGTKLTFHRNAPFEASLEPDVLFIVRLFVAMQNIVVQW